MDEITIPLKPTKRRERFRVLNDAVPGLILLFTGLSAFLDRGLTREPMPYIDVAVGALVVRFALAELKGYTTSQRMNWFDILGGVVIILDAINQYKPWKHFQPAHLLLFAGVVTILRALVADKIPKSRRVVISQEKLFVRTAPFRRLTLRWSDVARIDWTASALVFLVGNRETRLSLRRAENKEEVIHSILVAAREHGIEIAEAT